MELTFALRTDRGRVRFHNEDAVLVLERQRVLLVCDGAGGHQAGDLASALLAETVGAFFRNPPDTSALRDLTADLPDSFPTEERLVVASIRLANRRVFTIRMRDPRLRQKGMSSTVVVALFHPGAISIGHAGDSRAYRLRSTELRQLTEDHSYVNLLVKEGQMTPDEAAVSPKRNVITRAVGNEEGLPIDLRSDAVEPGDIYLLCSDGLTGMIEDSVLADVVSTHRHRLDEATARLVSLANQRGGKDNITVALARVDDLGPPALCPVGPRLAQIQREPEEMQRAEDTYLSKLALPEPELRRDRSWKHRATWAAASAAVLLAAAAALWMSKATDGSGPRATQLEVRYDRDGSPGSWGSVFASVGVEVVVNDAVVGQLRSPQSVVTHEIDCSTTRSVVLRTTDACWATRPSLVPAHAWRTGGRLALRVSALPADSIWLKEKEALAESVVVQYQGQAAGRVVEMRKSQNRRWFPYCGISSIELVGLGTRTRIPTERGELHGIRYIEF